jgi:molybdenum cofactor cytidylyltransferase
MTTILLEDRSLLEVGRPLNMFVTKPAGNLQPVSAVILAAGTSSRMGQAKQLLPLGQNTVLAQTLANVQSAALHEIILVLGASAETIRGQLPSPQGLKIVVNPAYQQGIASSLQAGLSAVDPNSDAALIILGDQPFIRPQTLDLIVEEYRRSQAQIVIPMYQGQRGNPVLLDRSVFAEVMALEGDVGSRAIFARHLDGIVNVEVEDKGILLDLDDPADYERLKV